MQVDLYNGRKTVVVVAVVLLHFKDTYVPTFCNSLNKKLTIVKSVIKH